MINNYFMGVDVGGSHITLALVNAATFASQKQGEVRECVSA